MTKTKKNERAQLPPREAERRLELRRRWRYFRNDSVQGLEEEISSRDAFSDRDRLGL